MKNHIKLRSIVNVGVICLLIFCSGKVGATTSEERLDPDRTRVKENVDNVITRGEFVVNLMKLFEEEVGPYGEGSYVFVDAGMDTPYGYYIQAAFYCQVINGVGEDNNYFKPNDPLTREQAAVILGQFMHSVNMGYNRKVIYFKDELAIGSWQKRM